MLCFQEKNVLVTGASMGIGRSLSGLFAREKANLLLADLEQEKESLESWAGKLRESYGVKAWTFYGDLTVDQGPEKLYREVVETVGPIHTLVNNAGIVWYGRFKEIPPARLEKMILLNCLAYAKLTRLFLPDMVEKNEGGILNVGSVAAFQNLPTMALYAGTKAFTQSFTESVRLELPRKSKVVVSTLNPPFTRTSLVENGGFPPDYIPKTLCYMEVDEMTASGFKAFKKGRPRYVPGLSNAILSLIVLRYLPRGVVDRLMRILTRNLSDFFPASMVKSMVKRRA